MSASAEDGHDRHFVAALELFSIEHRGLLENEGTSMNPIHNILVIVDPTASEHPSIVKGALLAEKLKARLELFVCETKAARHSRLSALMQRRATATVSTSLQAQLESLATPLRARGLDVTTEIAWGDPLHSALADRTKRTTADLVIKDTHHHSLAKRTFLTNTDWHLIRTCPVALLLTKATAWAHSPRVFAAIDPGHTNDKPAALDLRILDHASLISKRLGGELHALHAYLPRVIVAAATAGDPPMAMAVSDEDIAFEEQQTRKRVQELVCEYGVAAANIHVEIGGPAEVIPRIASARGADIVAMGAISRSGLERAFIGSTAEHVLEHLPCDALIVKSPDFVSMLPF